MTAAERRAAYLDDLGRSLQPLTVVQRIEVIDAVRQRLDAGLAAAGPAPTDADAERVLAELGSPEEVAARAIAGQPVVPGADDGDRPPGEPALPPLPTSSGTPSPAATPPAPAATAASAPPATSDPDPAPRTPTRTSLSDIPRMEWPEEPPPRPPLTRRWLPLLVVGAILLGWFFALFLLPVIVAVVGIVMLWTSPLWTRTERLVGTIVPPLTLGAFLPASAFLSVDGGIPIPLLLLPIAGLVAVGWLAARGVRAARRVDADHPAAERRRP